MLQAAWKEHQSAMEGYSTEMVEETLVKPRCGPVFSIGKTAVAGCYLTAQLHANARSVHRAQTGGLRGRPRLLRRNKDDVKEVGTVSSAAIGAGSFSANWQRQRIASSLQSWSPSGATLSHQLKRVNPAAASPCLGHCWASALSCELLLLIRCWLAEANPGPLPAASTAFSAAGPRALFACALLWQAAR